MSCIDDSLRQIRLKCRQLSSSHTSLESCGDNDNNKKVAVLMKYHQKMKNTLKLINEKKDKSKIKLMENIEKHQNLSKELNNRYKENKIFEEYVLEDKNRIKKIEMIKHQNDYFQLFHKKNVTKICQLKEEKVCISRLSLNPNQPIILDSYDDFMGFDSVTVSKSESHTSFQNKSYRSLYYNIKKNSDDLHNFDNSLMNVMKKTNSSMQNAVKKIDSLTRKRCDLEQIKLDSFCRLSSLESDLESLGNRVKTKRIPTKNPRHNFCRKQLKQLPVRQLYLMWTEMIISWQSYQYNHENYQY